MIESYQKRQQVTRKAQQRQVLLATVVTVYSDGLIIRFDGETELSMKRHKYNRSVNFSPGQRVVVQRIENNRQGSGIKSYSYIVAYPFG